MYRNAEQLPPETLLQDFDICVIGAGAAGIAIASRLCGCALKVLLLVSGHPDERERPDPLRQSIYKADAGPFLRQIDPVFGQRSRLHMYGGTTNHFGFWSRPLDECDLAPRPGYRDAAWPLQMDDLLPYYREAQTFGNFGPLNYDDLVFWEGALGCHCFPPRAGDTLKGARMRAQYDGRLHNFQLQFGEELRRAANVTALFNAHLLRFETTPDREHVTRLSCATIEEGRAGRRFYVSARRYVLAAGGVESTRLLQLSGDLGDNARGHLGRGFMLHPLIEDAAKVRFAQSVPREICNFFRDQQARLRPPAAAGEPYIPVTAPLVNPELLDEYCVFNTWGVLTPTADTLHKEAIGNFRLILRFNPARDEAILNLNWEQIPDENSRIILDPERTDPIFGQPLSHIDWRMRAEDKHTARRALEIAYAYLRGHGATALEWLTDLSGGADQWPLPPAVGALATGDHHMGSLRMSADPATGIVNRDARLHTVDNLYIAGCAIFPTGGFANPTLTIIALALRLADHLAGAPCS